MPAKQVTGVSQCLSLKSFTQMNIENDKRTKVNTENIARTVMGLEMYYRLIIGI